MGQEWLAVTPGAVSGQHISASRSRYRCLSNSLVQYPLIETFSTDFLGTFIKTMCDARKISLKLKVWLGDAMDANIGEIYEITDLIGGVL